MKNIKIIAGITGLLLALNQPAGATLYNYGTLAGGSALGAIPDNNTIGFSDAHTLSGLESSISALTLTFVLQGGFASDLSGYLRLGNLTGSPSYSLTSLINSQTLSEGSANTYSVSFTTSGFSSAFNNQNPNDTWTLFFADTSTGGHTTRNGWSLDITAVPEPVNVALVAFGLCLVGFGVARRWIKARSAATLN